MEKDKVFAKLTPLAINFLITQYGTGITKRLSKLYIHEWYGFGLKPAALERLIMLTFYKYRSLYYNREKTKTPHAI